jgi:hypothetical protein
MTLENLYELFSLVVVLQTIKIYTQFIWVSQDFYPLNFDVCFIYHVPNPIAWVDAFQPQIVNEFD